MPSEKVLKEKQRQVAELKEKLENSVAGVLVDYKGINVADDTKLRKELREAGVYYAVIKNTVIRRAVEQTGLAGLNEVLSGTTAVAISPEDHTAAARILCKYAADSDTFNIKCGYIDGQIADVATVEALAKLPTREVLLSTVCSAFNAPIAAFARAVQAVVDKNAPAE